MIKPGKATKALSKKCYKSKRSRIFVLYITLHGLLFNVPFKYRTTLLLETEKGPNY